MAKRLTDTIACWPMWPAINRSYQHDRYLSRDVHAMNIRSIDLWMCQSDRNCVDRCSVATGRLLHYIDYYSIYSSGGWSCVPSSRRHLHRNSFQAKYPPDVDCLDHVRDRGSCSPLFDCFRWCSNCCVKVWPCDKRKCQLDGCSVSTSAVHAAPHTINFAMKTSQIIFNVLNWSAFCGLRSAPIMY